MFKNLIQVSTSFIIASSAVVSASSLEELMPHGAIACAKSVKQVSTKKSKLPGAMPVGVVHEMRYATEWGPQEIVGGSSGTDANLLYEDSSGRKGFIAKGAAVQFRPEDGIRSKQIKRASSKSKNPFSARGAEQN